MACILNIDTSGAIGLLTLAIDGRCIHTVRNNNALEHASFLQPAVVQLLNEAAISFNAIDAVAVSNGPGSYTGLRVGLASAKGLCFAWNKPLITLNTLDVLAYSVMQIMTESDNMLKGDNENLIKDEQEISITDVKNNSDIMYCSMIDARRMEVFFALYNSKLEYLLEPSAAILDDKFLDLYLQKNTIVFTGNGMPKWRTLVHHPNAHFIVEPLLDKAICQLSHQAFVLSDFVGIDYAEPFYTKEFYTTHPAHRNL